MEESLIKRIMPHSVEAEQSVIGSMIMDEEAIVTAVGILASEDFYQKSYGVVFDAMKELHEAGRPVDLVTLQTRLVEKNVPPEISSLEFIKDIMDIVPNSANVKYYAEIVSEKAVLRKLIHLTEDISNACYSASEPLEDILEQTEKSVFALIQNRNSNDFKPIREIVLDALDNIERASHMKGAITGVATGFTDLDRLLSGLQPADLILLAARPSMGKTALALNIAQYVAFHSKLKAAVFSLEMPREQLVNRLFSLESQVDSQNIRTGNLNPSEWSRLVEGSNVVGSSGLIIDDTPGISVSELRSRCRKYKLEHGLDLVMIDYLQLMSGSGRSDSRQQEVSDISRALKGLARELHVPIIALSQLNRIVEQREDHKPRLADLRESGAIEQDADVVMFIYRDEIYNKDSDTNKGQAEIIVAKQRNGPIGTVELVWLPEYTKFANKEPSRN